MSFKRHSKGFSVEMEDGNWGSQTSIDHEEAQTDYNTLQMLEDLANGGNSNRVHQQNDEYIEETGTASSQSSIMSFDNSQNRMDVDGLSQSPGLTTLIEPSTSSITLKECVSDLIGEDQHWIYSKTVYQDLVSDSSFAVHKFHFDILQYNQIRKDSGLKPLRCQMSPSAAIKEIQENGIDAEFSKYFDLFAKDHMSILGDVFPYLMPKDDLLKFATAFFVKYPLLGDFYFEFKKRFPDAPFANYADGIDMYKQKLKYRFINRSAVLKDRHVWPYLPSNKPKASKKSSKGHSSGSEVRSPQPRKDFKFEYESFISPLNERIEGELSSKNKKAKK